MNGIPPEHTDELTSQIAWTDVIDRLPLGICLIDRKLTVHGWNATLARWTGQSRQAMLGANLSNLYPHLGADPYQPLLADLFADGHPALFPARLYNYFLPVLHVSETGERFMLQDSEAWRLASQPHLAIVAMRDVTAETVQVHQLRDERIRLMVAEQSLRKANESLERQIHTLGQLHRNRTASPTLPDPTGGQTANSLADTLLETMADAVLAVDRIGNIVHANRATERLFGYSAVELMAQRVGAVLPAFGTRDEDDLFRRFLASATPPDNGPNRTTRARRRDGSEITVDVGMGLATRGEQQWLVVVVRPHTNLTPQPMAAAKPAPTAPRVAAPPVQLPPISQLASIHQVNHTKPSAETQSPLNCRILLAEDGPDNQRLISRFLNKAGATTTIVGNGQEAVDTALAASNRGEPFDVVLMDMQMPVLDGYDATRKLRAANYPGQVVAITAHAMTGDREKCLEAGCNDYLTKPINRNELLATVERCLIAARASEIDASLRRS